MRLDHLLSKETSEVNNFCNVLWSEQDAKGFRKVSLFNLEGVRREIEGDIAQLGERLPCKQEVAGSNPTISTKRIKRHLVQDEGP